MKVKELIEKLQEFDGEMEIGAYDKYLGCGMEILSIELDPIEKEPYILLTA